MNFQTYQWYRNSLLSARVDKEQWILKGENFEKCFEVGVKFGKDIDIQSLKRRFPFEIELQRSASEKAFFEKIGDFCFQQKCPLCKANISHAEKKITIWNNDFYQCTECTHLYSNRIPSPKAVEAFYKNYEEQNDPYVDRDEINLRVEQIYKPKAQWVMDVFEKKFLRKPKNVLEVGAGTGHFLYALKKLGLEVAGIEWDKRYRDWSKANFAIDLVAEIKDLPRKQFDVVCSLNVIEHTTDPNDFIAGYIKCIEKNGMAVFETPKFNSLTSTIQKIYPDLVRGHISPYIHNHLFTETSLATLLYNHFYEISDVWYFGQDTTEIFLRVFYDCGAGDNYPIINKIMPELQKSFDMAYVSDLMLVAATKSDTID